MQESNFMLWYCQSQFNQSASKLLSNFSWWVDILEKQKQQTFELLNQIRVKQTSVDLSPSTLEIFPLVQSLEFIKLDPMDVELYLSQIP